MVKYSFVTFNENNKTTKKYFSSFYFHTESNEQLIMIKQKHPFHLIHST